MKLVFKNPQEGYVLNSNHSPVVNQGDALFHIGFRINYVKS